MFVVFPQLDIMENINFLFKHTTFLSLSLSLSLPLVYWGKFNCCLENYELRVTITSSLLTLACVKPSPFETGLGGKEEEERFLKKRQGGC